MSELLVSEDSKIRAKAGLIMTQVGDKRGMDTLANEAPYQDYLFQIAAGNSLKRAGDSRSEKFSIENLKDDSGKNLVDLRVIHRENGFRVSPIYENEETAHADIGINRFFHLGDNISIRYAIILSFGIREPKYRGMGLGEAALKRASDIIEEMGYNCSLVCTGVNLMAHRLYCQYGYGDRRFPWIYGKHLDRREIQEKDPNIITRDYINSDKSEVERLIQQYNLNTVGPADWVPRKSFGPWTKVAEYEGKLIGYADVYIEPFESVARINVMHIDIDFPDKHKVLIHLFSSIHDYALEEGKEMVTFLDPPVKYRDLILMMGYEIEPNNLRHRWVGMFKVINLPGFLREISPLLSLRLKRSLHYGWQGSLCIKGSRLNATIIIDKDGNVSVDDCPRENADICIITSDNIITDLVSCNGNMWESYKDNLLMVKPLYSERIRSLMETLFPVLPTKQGGWW
ncbi:GNAT family N-acetyltransferase [Candidatus Poribacteria bacterium]|nr:GNAT family N-acetyltransferase [Candidatus Poribacteria bacterium]